VIVKELREALRTLPATTHVVFCAEPGPGAVATPIIAALDTALDVTDTGTGKTSKQTVLILVGGK
jgi:hypothetical protein